MIRIKTILVVFLIVFFVCHADVALAHPEHLHLTTVLGWWTWDPLVLSGLTLSAFLYVRGTLRLWRVAGTGHGVSRGAALAFAAGWLTIAVALVSPLDRLSGVLFSAHMSQHELLMLIAAPLLVLGRPLVPTLWALPRRVRERVGQLGQRPRLRSTVRALTHPVVVLLVHGLVLWGWHIPALFQAALRNRAVHSVQHFMFFLSAALFFWALVHGRYGRIGYGVSVLFVFATALHSSLLGALLSLAQRLWYPMYEGTTSAWGIDALWDQQLAGLIMWVPAGVVLALFGLGLFTAWLGESERRAVRFAQRRSQAVLTKQEQEQVG